MIDNNKTFSCILLNQLEVALLLGYSYKGFNHLLYSNSKFPKPDELRNYPGASICKVKFWLSSTIEIYKTTLQYKTRLFRQDKKYENSTI